MKKFLSILIVLFISMSATAQFANDWIDYSKPHFKIEVNTEGVYRINAATLNSVGLNFVNSTNYQIFRDGKQVPIYINQTGTTINYIEFYAYPNDGLLDSTVFKNKDWQINEHHSLFSNTATYFLTFNTSGNNLRLTEQANTLSNLPPKEEYFYHTVINQYTSNFSFGKPYYVGNNPLYGALFSEGEGYMGGNNEQVNNSANSKTFSLNTAHHYSQTGLNATLKTVVVAWTNGAHHFKIKAGANTLNDYSFEDFKLVKSVDNLPNNLVSANTDITIEAVNTSSGTNRNNLALLELNYPRSFNFDNNSSFVFEMEGNGTVQYIELDNVNNLGSQIALYDLTNGYRLLSNDAINGSTFRFALPAATGKRKLVFRSLSNTTVNIVASITEKYFTDYSATANQGDYIILTHPNLLNTSELTDYANYRESINGGAHQVSVVDITELYDQFAYGVDHHANTVRAFVAYAKANWTVTPDYMFIIAKAREYHEYRNNSAVRNACLVPTFGQPGSDNLLVADNDSDAPNIAIGRIAASNASQISTYLEKVIEYETEQRNFGDPFQTVENKDFMKQILHFGGGSAAFEQNQIRGYLDNFKITAEDTAWGANTYSVFKTNSNPLQSIQSDFLRERIDDGVSIITFFGHSYAGGFDLSFDEPENYTNKGKYPLYIANGCNAGAIHSGAVSISERFIFAKQKGAVAYLSTTALSLGSSLNRFSGHMYKNFSQSEYNKGLGDIIIQTIEDVEACCANQALVMMVPHEMTLNGDPAIRLNQYDKPDYNIEKQNVSFSPAVVSTSVDSFSIALNIYNLGKAINEDINVEVSRIFSDGTETVVSKTIPAPKYKEIVNLKFPVIENNLGLGLNKFNIYIDNSDVVSELSETNNYLLNEISLIIGSDDIFPIFPYEFAIVPQQNVVLKASTGNVFAPAKNYRFQIDTSELFTNPLREDIIFSKGGVVNYSPNITMEDSTVYYWRVGADGTNKWHYSSFLYLKDEFPGWNQSHYYQWQKDNYSNVYIDTTRVFKFVDDLKNIHIKTGLFPNLPYQDMKWELNNAKMHNWSMNICSGSGGFGYNRGISIATVDNISGLPVDYANNGGNYGAAGNIHCNNVSPIRNIANFKTVGITPSNHPTPGVPWSQVIINFLNSIPTGHFVILYSINNPQYASMDPALINILNSKGSSISSTTSGAMILVYQNNTPSYTPTDVVGNTFSEIISTDVSISGIWNTGNFKSTLIGPAKEWGSFHWRYKANETPTSDQQSVSIYGVDNAGNETLVKTVTNALDTTLSFIDANNYPYLRLKVNTADVVDRTPLQTEYLRVLFDPAPELAINPNLYFEVTPDSLEQGDIYSVEVALENVSPWNMDSVWIKNSTSFADKTFEQNYQKNNSLKAFDTLHIKYNKSTLDNKYVGINNLILEANPLSKEHQLEQFHFNNFAVLNYEVIGDLKNPLLDVTFDGVHILDGDIVSAKPTISIQLKDENTFLALNDTSAMDVYIRNLQSGQMKRISYQSEKMDFFPANTSNLANNNKALIVLKEDFPDDGNYELYIKARDASGNSSSGTENRIIDLTYYDYKISFEIINKSTVSNVLNYPNPFTTQTHFVFTLTGSVVPDNIEIKIYNVRGTLVKQIRKEELGDIHIGVNKTQYTWNGTDQYGDKLANGVYLYKVYMDINEEDIEHLGIEQVDKFFKKGFGKMVFIR